MAQLIIERVLYSGFEFTLDGGITIFDGFPNMTSFDNICHFKTRNGANIIKNQSVTAAEVTVIDTFGGTGVYNYPDVSSLRILLQDLKFFDGMGSSSSGGSGVSRFNDLLDTFNYFGNNGKVALVDEAQQKLIASDFYNYNLLSQLNDVEIGSLVTDKVLGTEIINGETKLTLIDKPNDGTTYFSAVGQFDYNDAATGLTPLPYTTGELQLTNDTLGAYTFLSQNPYGVTSVWDESLNAFDFSQLSIGDKIHLRIDLEIDTTVSNQVSKLKMLFGEGSVDESLETISNEISYKTSGSHKCKVNYTFDIRNNSWGTIPAKLFFSSDNDADIVVRGFAVYIVRKSINILDVNDDNYKTFKIENIEPNIDDLTVNTTFIKLGYNATTSKINKVILDSEYSKYLMKLDEASNIYGYFIHFINKDNGRSLISSVTDLTLLDGYYFLDIEETTDFLNFNINDKVEVFITPRNLTSNDVVQSTIETFTYTTGAQVFTLANAPNNVDVHIGRTWQYPSDSVLAGNQVTIIPNLENGDKITIRKY